MSTDIAINPDRIQNLFSNLDTRQSLLAAVTHLHKTLTHHFSSLDLSLSQRSQALDSQIQALDSRTEETLSSLETRENAIADRLAAAAARIESRKQAAVSAAAGGGERRVVREYCRVMDWKGLLGFVLAKKDEAVGDRWEGTALREEIAAAVAEEAVDGMRMVLEAVEEFVDSRVEGKLVALADRRWACGVLIQAVVEKGGGGDRGGVGRGMKERAVGVLEKWKGVMGREKGGYVSGGGFGSGEARMFLQIVIGFGLKEMVGEEYLRKLLVQYTTNRQIGQFAKLAWTLGLADQIKDIVEELAKSRKNAVEEANDLELNATVAMLKCAEDNKLESKSTIDSLWKRVQQLEKAKEEHKKKSAPTSTSKPPNKRGRRGGGGPPSYPPKSGRFSNASPASRSLQATPSTFRTPYKNASRNMYEGPGPASYGPGYGGAVGGRASGPYGGAPTGGSYGGAPAGGSYGGAPIGGLYGGDPAGGPYGGAQAGGSYGGHGSYAGPRNFGSYDRSAASAPPPPYPPYHH
ncbi:hypothetical protein RHGRI_005383 [Rhododendron griersonianum]|uniref:FRIGIDA-like protein n=1 Tax=Rhododendron griersonianum TaxID=479676 RepID=A0AAV6LCV7_9ERIC|nr:hypothetical protein RHGRI_005383 [Rhododendron griersonianum]